MDFFTNYQDVNYLVTSLVSHLLIAIPLWKMGQKKNDAHPWFAWIPVLNGLLALRLAKRPVWWIVLFFIPLVNLAVAVVVMMDLCEQFGVNKWWGLLALLSPANIILMYVLAFMEHGVTPAPATASKAMPDAAPAPPPKTILDAEAPETNDSDLSQPETPKTE